MRVQKIAYMTLCFGLLLGSVVMAKTIRDSREGLQDADPAISCQKLYQKPSRKSFDACRLAVKKQPLSEENWQRWAQLHYRAGFYGKAQRYFSKALLLAKDFGKDNAVALALHGLARTYKATGAFGKAVERFEESLTFCDDDQKCIAGNHDGLGYIQLKHRLFLKAGNSFQRCLEHVGSLKKAKLRASCTYGLATVHFQKGDFAKAGQLCGESLSLYEGMDNKRGMAAALGCLAATAKKRHVSQKQWCAYKTRRARLYSELGELKKSLILQRGLMRSKCSTAR